MGMLWGVRDRSFVCVGICLQCRRPRFDPLVRKIPWRKEWLRMATHSSILAWRTPWTEEPGELQSMGSQRRGHFPGGSVVKNHGFFSLQCRRCREPPREIPPMTRSCGRELLSKASGLKGLPGPSRPSTWRPESVLLSCVFHQLSWHTGGYPWPPFSEENQLRALANKSPGHERNISNQTPSVSILACLAGISRLWQLLMIIYSLQTVRGMESIEPFKELKVIRVVLV